MRLGGTKLGTISTGRGLGNPLWDVAGSVPSLDLQFADTKSLTDARTGQNLITFSRASSGTYVDVNGTLQTANNNEARFDHAITGTVTNLLLQSNQFDTTWTNSNSTEVLDPSVTAPDGTNTAWELKDTVDGSAVTHQLNQVINFTAGTQYTLSCWIKAGTADRGVLLLPSAPFGGTSRTATYNFTTGLVTTSGTPDAAVVTAYPNDWWRLSVTATASTTTSGSIVIRVGVGAGTYQGVGTGTMLIWGAQLEQSSTAGTYVPTSTTSVTKNFTQSLGLLVEEQRTNLLVQSNGFDTTWTNTNSTETSASGIAPDGTNTAWQLRDTVDASAVVHSLNQTFSFTAGTTYTLSAWGKAGTLDRMQLAFPATVFTNATARTATVTFSTGALLQGGSPLAVSVVQFPNGWVRLSITATVDITTSGAVALRTSTAGGNTYQGDGTGTILVWGAQLEAGSFPTSYIPTTTATATRSADVASITGTNFSSWYNQSKGTLYAEAQIGRQNALAGAAICGIETGVQNAEALYLHYRGTGLTAAQIFDNSVLQMDQSPYGTAVAANTTTKHAFAVKLNDSVSAGGGTALTTDTVCTMPTPDRMLVGFSTVSSNYLSGVIRRLTYWPDRLANPTLQNITQ